MTIGEVARRAGIRTSHIRFYERTGVLPEPERVAGRRRYDDDVLRRLAIVGAAQRAGFSLDEIKRLTGAEGEAGPQVRALAERKLPALDVLIARAQAVRTWLEAATDCDCPTLDVCALFADPAYAPPALSTPPAASPRA